jgi:cyclase
VAVRIIADSKGAYEADTDNGRERTGVDPFVWAVRAAELGAGELLVTSIDREGTGKGFDVDLTSRIADAVAIPVIACGGAGQAEYVLQILEQGHADAVCLASELHYDVLRRYGLEHEASSEGNVESLKKAPGFSRVQSGSVPELKGFLAKQGIACRHHEAKTIHA